MKAMRTRLGWQAELIVALLFSALVVGNVGGGILSRESAPEAAAFAYLAAEDRTDTAAVWSATFIDTAGLPSVDASLLSQSDLHAQLSTQRLAHSEVRVLRTLADGAKTQVDLVFKEGDVVRQQSLLLRRDPGRRIALIAPAWQIIVKPAVLDLTLPPGGGALLIDAVTLELAAGDHRVAVLPGVHHVAIGATALFKPWNQDFDASQSYPASVAVKPDLQLTDGAKKQAAPLVAKAIGDCALKTAAAPSGCPQSTTASGGKDVTWHLVGDPLGAANFNLRADGAIAVSGHYQMTATPINANPQSVSKSAAGGAYIALLTASGSEMAFKAFSDAGAVPAAARPQVPDAQLFDAARSGLAACLSIASINVPGCPNSLAFVADGQIANVRWSAAANPITSATISFDGQHSLFTVSGEFQATLQYDGLNLYQPPIPRTQTIKPSFRADLLWDGNSVIFVAFEQT